LQTIYLIFTVESFILWAYNLFFPSKTWFLRLFSSWIYNNIHIYIRKYID